MSYAPRTKSERLAYLRVVGAYDCRLRDVAPTSVLRHLQGMPETEVSRMFHEATGPIVRGEEGGHELVHALGVLAQIHTQFTALLASIARRIPKEARAEP